MNIRDKPFDFSYLKARWADRDNAVRRASAALLMRVRATLPPLMQSDGERRALAFGSVVPGRAGSGSGLDLLVYGIDAVDDWVLRRALAAAAGPSTSLPRTTTRYW